MQYFTRELWREINMGGDIAQKADAQWIENSIKYQQYFETIRHHIPKRIIAKMDSANGFHDCLIRGLLIKCNNKKEYMAQVELFDGAESFYLEMEGLEQAKVDIESFRQCILGKLTWGYHEFRLTERKTLQLAVLCDIENEFLFEFKRISIKSG